MYVQGGVGEVGVGGGVGLWGRVDGGVIERGPGVSGYCLPPVIYDSYMGKNGTDISHTIWAQLLIIQWGHDLYDVVSKRIIWHWQGQPKWPSCLGSRLYIGRNIDKKFG